MTWTAGSWLQQRMVRRWSHRSVITVACVVTALGSALTAAPIVGAPFVLSYAAWGAVGVAMGASFNALYLTAVESAGRGGEGAAVAALQTVNRLGIALGTGLAGAAIALTSVKVGLALAFGLAVAAAVTAALVSVRLDAAPGERA
jgi:predicted MFS family arabinose efflux permease